MKVGIVTICRGAVVCAACSYEYLVSTTSQHNVLTDSEIEGDNFWKTSRKPLSSQRLHCVTTFQALKFF
jgi:hypothetical protein